MVFRKSGNRNENLREITLRNQIIPYRENTSSWGVDPRKKTKLERAY